MQIGVTVVVSCDLNGEEAGDACTEKMLSWVSNGRAGAKVERSDRYGGGTMTSLRKIGVRFGSVHRLSVQTYNIPSCIDNWNKTKVNNLLPNMSQAPLSLTMNENWIVEGNVLLDKLLPLGHTIH